MKKPIKQIVFSFIRAAFLALFIALIVYMIARQSLFIVSDQAFINTKVIALRSPIDGILHELKAPIGSAIAAQTPLFEITNPFFANTDIYIHHENLSNLIDSLKSELLLDEVRIKKEQKNHDRLLSIKNTGAIAARDIDEAENTLSVISAAIETKKNRLVQLTAKFSEIQAQLKLQKTTQIPAATDGVLWAVLAKNGEQVAPADEIAQMINKNDIWVDAFFSERYASDLLPGTEVEVKDLTSQRKWKGRILFIRCGIGRVAYNTAVEIPPSITMRRLIAVRVSVDWQNAFGPAEFYGVGRSLVVTIPRSRNGQTPQK